MSTKQRYGDAVLRAVQELSYLVDTYVYVGLAIGEVAERAGVSKPTAKKYLDLLKDMDVVNGGKIGNQFYYRLRFNSEDY